MSDHFGTLYIKGLSLYYFQHVFQLRLQNTLVIFIWLRNNLLQAYQDQTISSSSRDEVPKSRNEVPCDAALPDEPPNEEKIAKFQIADLNNNEASVEVMQDTKPPKTGKSNANSSDEEKSQVQIPDGTKSDAALIENTNEETQNSVKKEKGRANIVIPDTQETRNGDTLMSKKHSESINEYETKKDSKRKSGSVELKHQEINAKTEVAMVGKTEKINEEVHFNIESSPKQQKILKKLPKFVG